MSERKKIILCDLLRVDFSMAFWAELDEKTD